MASSTRALVALILVVTPTLAVFAQDDFSGDKPGRKLHQNAGEGIENILKNLPSDFAQNGPTYDSVPNPEGGGPPNNGRRLLDNGLAPIINPVQAAEDEGNADGADALIDGAFNTIKGGPPTVPNPGAESTPGDPQPPPNPGFGIGRKLQQNAIEGVENAVKNLPSNLAQNGPTYNGVPNPEGNGPPNNGRHLLDNGLAPIINPVQAAEDEGNADGADAIIDGAFNTIKGGPPTVPNPGAESTPGDPQPPPNPGFGLGRKLLQNAIEGVENALKNLPSNLAQNGPTYNGVPNPEGDGPPNNGRRLLDNGLAPIINPVQAAEDEGNADGADAIIDGAFNTIKGGPPTVPDPGAESTPGDPQPPPNPGFGIGRKL